ncbi:MAG: CRISPR-associated endonuclease Cas2 [Lactobacillales bacterium]|jgi:CRISPR-associated protein Cas2|nr:CRISPR-associated endonuclease Cas2 [Lactobacillales bacterium]
MIRYMRQVLFFDLPTETSEERRNYRRFRKFLLSEGFLMLQFSVYSKLSLNDEQAKSIRRRIEENKPPGGSVLLLKVTEKQFAKMDYIVGDKLEYLTDSMERVLFLGIDPREEFNDD